MRAFRFAVGTFVVQAKNVDMVTNSIGHDDDQVQDGMEDFENLKNSVLMLQEWGTKFAAETEKIPQYIADALADPDFEESLKAAVATAQEVEEDVMESFENLKNSLVLDTDNDGSISREELQAKVQHLGLDPVATQVVEQIFNELDMNGDKQVEMDEFVEKLKDLETKFAAESQKVQQNIVETLKAAVSGIVETLEFDPVSREDLNNYFEQIPDSEAFAVFSNWIQELFHDLDTDESGVVTQEEVKAAAESLAAYYAGEAKNFFATLSL